MTIAIIVNNKTVLVNKNSNCFELIKQLSFENTQIALEINQKIIPKSNYLTTVLTLGDKVEIVKAVGGG